MSRRCPSCEGIIGVDCFNPDECAYITMKMDAEKERKRWNEIERLVYECRELSEELDYYKRLADAAGEYISELELSDTCPLICDEDHCQECNQKHDKYNSILKEREDNGGRGMNPKIIDNPPKMWWSGDKRVEPYMPKINEALERNGLTGDAKTDCYNRAYEAVYKAIIDATAERDRYKAEMKYLAELLEDSNVTICKLCKRLNPQHENCTGCSDLKTRIAALAKIKEG